MRARVQLSWPNILIRYWWHRSPTLLPVQSFPRLGRLIADRCRLLIVWKPHPRRGSTSPFCLGKYRVAGFLRGSQVRLVPSLKVSSCTGYHTRLTPLPNGPSFQTDQVYESCPGVEDQLAPQRDEPGSMGVASGQLSGGPRQLTQGGYIWSLCRSRIC